LSQFTAASASVPIRLLHFSAGDSLISMGGQLSFSYAQNRIDLEFIGISFRNPADVVYRYRMQPGDEWNHTTSGQLSWPQLQHGRYRLEVQASADGTTWSPEPLVVAFVIQRPWYLSWSFMISAGIGLAALVWLMFRYQINRRMKKEKQHRHAVEIELKALRAQMNPHFIFNSLNAIQDFILSHRSEEANEYLTKFSRLIRLILVQSRKQLVTLEEEIQLLSHYLELESLRFGDKFDYEIEVAPGVDAGRVYIPSLLLQPVAENSVNHAFRGLSRKGRIRISAERKNSTIVCMVEDNGIGRTNQNHSVAGHLPVATSIIEERMTAINQLRGGSMRYQTFDLTDAAGQPRGTGTQFIFNSDLQPE
jgi:hypothetical protein